MGYQEFNSVVATLAQALDQGAVRESATRFAWDVAGNCETPVTRETFSRPTLFGSRELRRLAPEMRSAFIKSGLVRLNPQRGFEWAKGENHPLWLVVTAPCRKCGACLRRRARLWAHKAQLEIERAPRTWFATYTFTPDEHYRLMCVARDRAAKSSTVFEHIPPDDQFRLLCAAAGPDITRYIKRIRKESGTRLRYLLVAERHASGLPHWHALVHEVQAAMPIRKAVLKGQWPHGFTRFKLVENKGAAWYLCKYLSKDIATRVRSSIRYGLDATCVHRENNISSKEEYFSPVNMTPNTQKPVSCGGPV
jgi:hypothetical protein